MPCRVVINQSDARTSFLREGPLLYNYGLKESATMTLNITDAFLIENKMKRDIYPVFSKTSIILLVFVRYKKGK